MRNLARLATVGVMVFAGGLAWAQKIGRPRQPTPVTPSMHGTIGTIVPFAVSNGSVTPGSISFTSSNPDSSPVSGSGTTTVSFRTTVNPTFRVWALALSGSFTGCNSPAANRVTVACQTATAGVTCAPSAALSTTAPPGGGATLVASGRGNHNPNTITVRYTFQDAWNYQAGTACPLSIQYVYTAP